YNPPKVIFNKQYLDPQSNKPSGKPIVYEGNVTFYKSHPPTMTGIYVAQVQRGHFYNTRFDEVRNIWDAEWSSAAAGGHSGKILQPDKPVGPQAFQDNLMKIALVIIAIFAGIAF